MAMSGYVNSRDKVATWELQKIIIRENNLSNFPRFLGIPSVKILSYCELLSKWKLQRLVQVLLLQLEQWSRFGNGPMPDIPAGQTFFDSLVSHQSISLTFTSTFSRPHQHLTSTVIFTAHACTVLCGILSIFCDRGNCTECQKSNTKGELQYTLLLRRRPWDSVRKTHTVPTCFYFLQIKSLFLLLFLFLILINETGTWHNQQGVPSIWSSGTRLLWIWVTALQLDAWLQYVGFSIACFHVFLFSVSASWPKRYFLECLIYDIIVEIGENVDYSWHISSSRIVVIRCWW